MNGGEAMRHAKTLMVLVLGAVLSGCTAGGGQPKSNAIAEDPDAVTPPLSLLQKDTVEALQHDRRTSGLAYVGVWAATAQGCAMIDQTAYDGFAVITPSSVRQFEERCETSEASRQGNRIVLAAKCSAEGETTSRTVDITMKNAYAMHLSNDPRTQGFHLVRCHLQR